MIDSPTLVIAGGCTSPVPREQIADLVDSLPDGRRVKIEAGHHVHATNPQEYIARLLSFVD